MLILVTELASFFRRTSHLFILYAQRDSVRLLLRGLVLLNRLLISIKAISKTAYCPILEMGNVQDVR